MDKIILDKGWTIEYGGQSLSASVPGDITVDLWKNGIIENPYYGLNHKKLHWIINEDFTYKIRFDLSDAIFNSEEILIEFNAIDTFADIYLNDVFLGHTENMFLKYCYSIKDSAKKKDNILTVRMLSTGKAMDKIDDKGYFAVFNIKRLFVRKAQCHFGWDWAPDMPGYGICGDVAVIGTKKHRLKDVHYLTYNDGNVSIFADLNYTVRQYIDIVNKQVRDCSPECKNDTIRYTLAKNPDETLNENNSISRLCKATGEKNFSNFYIENPKLWYPTGYGEHPLYAYKVELIRNGETIDERSGWLAFREVKLCQEPFDENRMKYRLQINGREVFVKGSNWVPAECFIGCIKDEKYERLIQEAVDANFNMLRVWGGGLYEKDIFYDICDRKGIMVWQDLMFACSDIPEDDPYFVEITKKEIKYQVIRLRNHPSLVYWCGGNEKTGSYGLQISKGDYFIDVILRGIVENYDGTRPYARQSPCSMTDVGNDETSGESHAGSFESSLISGVLNYRNKVSESGVTFVSECAIMGPGTLETYKKMFPEDKLWPMNEYWNDRLMENPYSAYKVAFADRQKLYADTLYGKSDTIEQFIAKGMTAHAETMRAEIEFARANRACGGFMNWMYSDIWPSATWAVVDYYCEPKQVYYQMKRSYAPINVTFVQNENKRLQLVIINDGLSDFSADIIYGLRSLSGETLWRDSMSVDVKSGEKSSSDIVKEFNKENCYLFAEYELAGEKQSTVFSYDMWHTCKFESDYETHIQKSGEKYAVTVKANKFAKGITLRMPDNYRFSYSDNYFDLQTGESKTVYVDGATGDDIKKIVITDFAKECR